MSQMEKTEKATEYKLQKAREQGQVAKSLEFNSAMSLLSAMIVLSALWQTQLADIKQLLRNILANSAGFHFTLSNISHLFKQLLISISGMILPLGLAIIITVILSTLVQTGFVWSAKALKPDIKRLNFMQGIKRYFSIKLLFDGAKTSLKFIAFILLITLSFKSKISQFLMLMQQQPENYPALLMALFFKLSLEIFLMLCVIALIDLRFSHWKYAKDQRMSRQELKDEYKQREGDPKIKSKIKQLQKEMRARSASIKQIKHADVLITNPSHIAIALQFKRGEMPAPKVICKARGELALVAKKTARRHGIKIIENKPFARSLYQAVQLNQYIDAQFFPIAASIFNQIYQERRESVI